MRPYKNVLMLYYGKEKCVKRCLGRTTDRAIRIMNFTIVLRAPQQICAVASIMYVSPRNVNTHTPPSIRGTKRTSSGTILPTEALPGSSSGFRYHDRCEKYDTFKLDNLEPAVHENPPKRDIPGMFQGSDFFDIFFGCQNDRRTWWNLTPILLECSLMSMSV